MVFIYEASSLFFDAQGTTHEASNQAGSLRKIYMLQL